MGSGGGTLCKTPSFEGVFRRLPLPQTHIFVGSLKIDDFLMFSHKPLGVFGKSYPRTTLKAVVLDNLPKFAPQGGQKYP